MGEKYTFRQCTQSNLNDRFGLRKTFSSAVLDSWLQAAIEISDEEKIVLRNFQALLHLNSDAWNEQELSLHFIGPVLGLARFTEIHRFNLFAERPISAIIPGINGDIELSGEPDGLIATGYWEPKIPMFAFSEYKRKLDPDGDPVGQTLAAMLVGQALNNQPQPIYGCYVVGHDWYFLVLEENQYTVSRDYSANTDELFEIFRILKGLKVIIMDLTAE